MVSVFFTVLGALGLTGTHAYFLVDAINYAREADISFDAAKVEGTVLEYKSE